MAMGAGQFTVSVLAATRRSTSATPPALGAPWDPDLQVPSEHPPP